MNAINTPNISAIEEIVEFGAPFTWFKRQPDHNSDARTVRNWIARYVSSKSPNAVFMDTTTIHTAYSLLQGDSKILTPMTLLDSLTTGHWEQSLLYLSDVSHRECPYPEDRRAIQHAWEAILGPVRWDNWWDDTEDFVHGQQYEEQSNPPKFLADAIDFFKVSTSADKLPQASATRVSDFIHECNLRSLFNWSIAYALKLPYVPNAFRLPFQQLLYSNAEAVRQYLVQFLDDQLLKKAQEVQSIEHRLRVPLFLSAIFRQASTLPDVVHLLQEYRSDGASVRKHKAELDDAIRREDYKLIRKLMRSMEVEEKQSLWGYAIGAVVGVVGLGYIGAALHGLSPWSTHALQVAGEMLAPAGIAKVGEEAAISYLHKPRFRFINKAADFASASLNMSDKVSALWKTRIGNDFVATAERLRNLRY